MLLDTVSLKEDDVQIISDAAGDVLVDDRSGLGLYSRDTRFLSRFELTVNGQHPLCLSHTASRHYIATFQAVNQGHVSPDGDHIPAQSVSVRRSRFVTALGFYERIGFMNCNPFPLDLTVELHLDADFRDTFAVRGFKDQPRPFVERVAGEGAIQFATRGRDGIRRATNVLFSRLPDQLTSQTARFCLHLQPRETTSVVVRVQPIVGQAEPMGTDFDAELDNLAASYRLWEEESTHISTDNTLFDRELLRASRNDIRTLLEHTPDGVVPHAGLPWYSVPFGRDAIITALQTLIYNPSIAEGVLRYLAAHQGRRVDAAREEEPGKIMHEIRRGELAMLGEVPHTPYYGTVDATPLYVVLFCETLAWTDDQQLYEDLLPSVRAALNWIDAYGDRDGDGYVEYDAKSVGGVINQGWKDSATAVQHPDGTNAPMPIALVEVQGYVYHAKTALAALYRKNGQIGEAETLERSAIALREQFNRDFWMEDEQYYALALDAEKSQVRAVSSNAGHCLWSGICHPEKAAAVARRLLAPDMFSGWGVRTLSSLSPNYNPMSYHNGSVWPHDTAIIALGLRRAGFAEEAAQLVEAVLEAGFRFADARLPELFSGFPRDRRFNSSPAAILRSCSPQAWSAGAVFMLLQALLDLRPDNGSGVSASLQPTELFHRLSVRNLRVNGHRLSVELSDDAVPA